jgi:hypothetical protein
MEMSDAMNAEEMIEYVLCESRNLELPERDAALQMGSDQEVRLQRDRARISSRLGSADSRLCCTQSPAPVQPAGLCARQLAIPLGGFRRGSQHLHRRHADTLTCDSPFSRTHESSRVRIQLAAARPKLGGVFVATSNLAVSANTPA